METGNYTDIIFFAIVAVFILLKLRTTLGRKNDNENISLKNNLLKPKDKKGEVVPFPNNGNKKIESVNKQSHIDVDEIEITDVKLAKKIDEIKSKDISFTTGRFLAGAKIAFEMVIKAFNDGDKILLKNLLSSDTYKEFIDVLTNQEKSSKKEETTLVSVISSNILSADIYSNKARVEVEFVSEQINITKDESGNITDGDPTVIEKIKDVWVFERDMRSNSPNWSIIAT